MREKLIFSGFGLKEEFNQTAELKVHAWFAVAVRQPNVYRTKGPCTLFNFNYSILTRRNCITLKLLDPR